MELSPYLDDLERRIDEAKEQELLNQWLAFADHEFQGEIFSPWRSYSANPGLEWPYASVNQTIEKYDLMVLRQFAGCSGLLNGRAKKNGKLLCVRANYGTGILSTPFGTELFVMEEELNTLPSSRPLGNPERIRQALDRGIPDFSCGLCGKVFRMGEIYAEIAGRYPKIGRCVFTYHPDFQGPMDVLELLWGSNLFVDVYDNPDLIKQFLELITDTYITFMRKWFEIIPPRDPTWSTHWGTLHRGQIMIRNDSAMNFSPEMYEEFIRPYDQRLFDEFGGGAIHFCGRGSHFIGPLSEMQGLHAVHLSQPHLNDMEVIYQNTVDKSINLLRLKADEVQAALTKGRDLRHRVHCG